MTTALELVLLGTGTPLYSPNRSGAGNLVIAGDTRVMVDCGWGASRRLNAAGVPQTLIDAVFFTHLHSDHITDFPDLLIMRWTAGATKPLIVYGPVGTRAMIDAFLAALSEDIRFRFAHHGEKLSQDGIRCDVHELPVTNDRARAATFDTLTIDAFAVDHYPVEPALGYRFERSGRSIVFSGDTKMCESLTRACAGADMLVCEAMNAGMVAALASRLRDAGNERNAGMIDDVLTYHISTDDVAALARDAGVRHAVLSHILPGVPDDGPLADAFVAGMSEIYDGQITLGRDLQRFALETE